MQSEGTSSVNRGNELQFEKASCVNRENDIVIHENGFTIRRDGLHKLRYSYLFLLFFFLLFLAESSNEVFLSPVNKRTEVNKLTEERILLSVC